MPSSVSAHVSVAVACAGQIGKRQVILAKNEAQTTMKIHEYQAKQLFARYGVPIPRGFDACSPDEAETAATTLIREAETDNAVAVVKAQIHAGGRGKAGGIKLVRSGTEARKAAESLLGRPLVTRQTGPGGQVVRRLYVEQGLTVERELYVAFVIDRDVGRVAMVTSTEGGMDIEQVATQAPEKIHTLHIDPFLGLAAYQARQGAFRLGLDKRLVTPFVELSRRLYGLFVAEDCSLCEINPLVVVKGGQLMALDAKINFDDNAEIRHREWTELRDASEEDAVELEAKQAGLSYVSLDGDIGCLVNGAGLAMATMDIVQSHGGHPANFLDVGGGASRDQVARAFGIILRSANVKAIFVNIFGGIMKCDVIAAGIVEATRALGLQVPLIVRLEGTNAEQGRRLLADSGLVIHAVSTMAEGAHAAVTSARGED